MKREEAEKSSENHDLYQMVKKVYSMKNPVTRLLYIGKIKENEKLSRQALNDSIVNEIGKLISEVKSRLEEPQSDDFFSHLILFLGSGLGSFCIVLLEASRSESVVEFIKLLNGIINADKSNHQSVSIVSFIEDSPNQILYPSFKHESNLSDGSGLVYKDKPLLEKGWILYDKICEFGAGIRKCKETRDVKEESQIKNAFLKNMPGYEDIKDLTSPEFISLDSFVKMYCDVLDVELDNDIIWPLHWHLNA